MQSPESIVVLMQVPLVFHALSPFCQNARRGIRSVRSAIGTERASTTLCEREEAERCRHRGRVKGMGQGPQQRSDTGRKPSIVHRTRQNAEYGHSFHVMMSLSSSVSCAALRWAMRRSRDGKSLLHLSKAQM